MMVVDSDVLIIVFPFKQRLPNFLGKFYFLKSRTPTFVSCYKSRKDARNAYQLHTNTNNVGCEVLLNKRIIPSFPIKQLIIIMWVSINS